MAISVERSIEMLIGVLGILKAGAAYVPLDAAYPAERLAFMLKDSQACALLTQTKLLPDLPASDLPIVCLDRDWDAIAKESAAELSDGPIAENLAYVIYTSGSTGRPKGVAMNHGTLGELVRWQLECSALQGRVRTVQFASLSFDVSFQEIFSTLCAGSTLILVSEDVRRDASKLLYLLKEQAVERLFIPYVGLQQLADAAETENILLPALSEINASGEQLKITPKIAQFLGTNKQCRLHTISMDHQKLTS